MCSLQYQRVKSKGAQGLAFETWDPSNQFPLETRTILFVIRANPDFLPSVASVALSKENHMQSQILGKPTFPGAPWGMPWTNLQFCHRTPRRRF
jgi:hypothetical protein